MGTGGNIYGFSVDTVGKILPTEMVVEKVYTWGIKNVDGDN